MSYKKFFFKGSISKSLKSSRAVSPGQESVDAVLERQNPVLLGMIPYFVFYEDDLRLSPLTGLVRIAELGCRG